MIPSNSADLSLLAPFSQACVSARDIGNPTVKVNHITHFKRAQIDLGD